MGADNSETQMTALGNPVVGPLLAECRLEAVRYIDAGSSAVGSGASSIPQSPH